jgi:hypothetical protein
LRLGQHFQVSLHHLKARGHKHPHYLPRIIAGSGRQLALRNREQHASEMI